jgi:hemerythrin superfamily protein
VAQATEGRDAIEVIEADHRAVEPLFRQLTSSTSAEEQLLYPRARHLLHNDKPVDHAIDEHSQLKRVLDDLDGKSPR